MTIQLDRPGECRQCGKVLTSADQIASSLTNTPDGLTTVRQFWHQACWDKRAADAFQRWLDQTGTSPKVSAPA